MTDINTLASAVAERENAAGRPISEVEASVVANTVRAYLDMLRELECYADIDHLPRVFASARAAYAAGRDAGLEEARKSVWDALTQRYEDAKPDGLSASGEFSETVQLEQMAFRKGILMARLSALRIFNALKGGDA